MAPLDYREIARQKAAKYGLIPEVFERQIAAESGFNPAAVSSAGATGIAQIMPSTAKGWGVNPRDPVASLDAAAKNMAAYIKTYGGAGTSDPVKVRTAYEKALQAYNAGPGSVGKYFPAETKNYISKIIGPDKFSFTDALASGQGVLNAAADGGTTPPPEPIALPRKDFNQIFTQVASDFLARNLLNPASSATSTDAQAYLAAADKLDESTSIEDQALAEEYRNQAIQAQTIKDFSGGLDPMQLISKYIETKQNVSEYNKQQEILEKYANTVRGASELPDTVEDTVLPTAGKGLAYKGAVLTSAKDTTGEPGFDFVIPGGRGAAFRAPFNAQVVKVVGNQNWETNLEKGPGKRGYGNYVDLRVKTPDGKAFDVRLAHFDKVNPQLKPGAVIGPGTLIGTQGRTGSTTGAHVSWDMYDPGKNTTSPEVLRYRDIFADRIRKGQPLL
jgi:murein DD-endopeptidase MepM/ murein hydrolase activator NlpD